MAGRKKTSADDRAAGVEMPDHVAIIMDGNGRWATQRGLPRIEGHKEGEHSITDVIRASSEWGLKALTLFAFSTENWKRSPEEVDFLMSFNEQLLEKRVSEFHEMNIKIRFVGRREGIPDTLLNRINEDEERTKNNSGLKLNVAFNYGGRAELVDAFLTMVKDLSEGKLDGNDIDEGTVSSYLYAPDVPDLDIMIRTAGEQRVSNFLLWELAYSELYFTPILWPDFRRDHLLEAIIECGQRVRRFGDVTRK